MKKIFLSSILFVVAIICVGIAQSIPSVKIGKQIWMTQNLNVDTFRNGDPIPEARSWREFGNAGWDEQPAYCYLYNDPRNGSKFGKLYNWYAVNDPRGLAPEGWHVASDAEWTLLTEFLGGEDTAGTKMKSTNGWIDNGNGNNQSGFSGLPGGIIFIECKGRQVDQGFFGINETGLWWSSTEYDAGWLGNYTAWTRTLNYSGGNVNRLHYCKKAGLSVRCVRD